jgi:hypothetical protein
MTENDIKEDISRGYLGLIASRAGFYPMESRRDYGIDIRYAKTSPRRNKGYVEDPLYICVQLKATTEKGITISEKEIRYPLEAKTYNDLVDSAESYQPIILILFVLPENKDEWVIVKNNEMIVRKCAYWFKIDKKAKATDNNSAKTIAIPRTNLVDLTFFPDIYKILKN